MRAMKIMTMSQFCWNSIVFIYWISAAWSAKLPHRPVRMKSFRYHAYHFRQMIWYHASMNLRYSRHFDSRILLYSHILCPIHKGRSPQMPLSRQKYPRTALSAIVSVPSNGCYSSPPLGHRFLIFFCYFKYISLHGRTRVHVQNHRDDVNLWRCHESF